MAFIKKYSIVFILLAAGVLCLLLKMIDDTKTATVKNNIQSIPQKAVYHIGILKEGNNLSQNRMEEGVRAILEAKGYKDKENVRYEVISSDGDSKNLGNLAQQLVKRKKDMIIALGTDASKAAARATKTIPIVAIGVYQFKTDEEWKDCFNVTGISDSPAILNQLRIASRIFPIKTLGIIYNNQDEESLMQLKLLRNEVSKKGIHLYEIAWNDGQDVEQQAIKFKGHVDAVYIPYDEKVIHSFQPLIETLSQNKIPVISESVDLVREGAVFSVSSEYYRMGYDGGVIAYELLGTGKKPYEISINQESDPDIVVNMRVLKLFNKQLPTDIWQRARKLYLYEGLPPRP